ncbi:MAG TPA: phage major capsid protein, partial [Sinorhizobium sp.]|nr:phage major capsid protein [Sinorhizobium sp.]
EIKAGLVRGLSIGFKPIEYEPLDPKDPFGGLRFSAWNWYELSLVTIPANADAQISIVKSIDQRLQASSQAEASGSRASGAAQGRRDGSPRGTPERKATRINLKLEERSMSKTVSEQIAALESSRAAKAARMEEVMQKSIDEGRSTDEAEQEEFDTLQREVEAIDGDLKRLRVLERQMQAKAQPVQARTIDDGSAARAPQIRVQAPQMPPGVRLARVAKCLALAQGNRSEALEIGKAMYPSDAPTLATLEAAKRYGEVSDMAIKAAVPAGSTTDTQWAGALVTAASGEAGVVGDFVEYLRPQTIIGKFGTGGIPSLRRVPFRVGLVTQHTGGTGYWVGEGAPKPVTKVDLSRRTLLPTKCATIAVVTDELLRDSSPSADVMVRDSLTGALVELMDSDFIDPASTASGARPASITNGAPSTIAGGGGTYGSADNVRDDVRRMFANVIGANMSVDSGVWILRQTTALALSLMQNPLGQAEFPDITTRGGTFLGYPVIVSQHVPAASSPSGDYVVFLDAQSVWLADEGGMSIDMSREASIVMSDAPTGAAFTASPGTVTAMDPTEGMVSLWQQNLIGWRAERTINWLRARPQAVQLIEGVNWGEGTEP